jgi:hypothetical protein
MRRAFWFVMVIVILSAMAGLATFFKLSAKVETVASEGQPLTVQRAYDLLTPLFEKEVCGAVVPVGELNFPVTAAAEGGDRHSFALNAIALKEIGVIKWIDMPSMLGMAHFRLELNDQVDSTQLIDFRGGKCIKFNIGPQKLTVLSVSDVKGGRTNWDGVIVLATSKAILSELYKRYQATTKGLTSSEERHRFLFRYDPFTKQWRNKTDDRGPLNGEFYSQNVPTALKED